MQLNFFSISKGIYLYPITNMIHSFDFLNKKKVNLKLKQKKIFHYLAKTRKNFGNFITRLFISVLVEKKANKSYSFRLNFS